MLARRVVAACVCVAILIASTGALPVWVVTRPLTISKLDTGEWWPCRDHTCGCMSPQMCRTVCRCFKPAKPAKPSKPSCCSGSPSSDDAPELLRPVDEDTPAIAAGGKSCEPRSETASYARAERAPSGRLAFRSATCAGQSTVFALAKGFDWLVEFPVFDISLARIANVSPALPPRCDAPACPPTPPPPRPTRLGFA